MIIANLTMIMSKKKKKKTLRKKSATIKTVGKTFITIDNILEVKKTRLAMPTKT